MAFQCVIVTPEAQVFDQQVTQAIVPAHDGLVGILTDRAPLLVKLGINRIVCTLLPVFASRRTGSRTIFIGSWQHLFKLLELSLPFFILTVSEHRSEHEEGKHE